MKYKMTAVLVALAMMFAGVFVMADGDGTDADDLASPTTFVLVAGATESTDTYLMLNDNAYQNTGATKVVTWKINTAGEPTTISDTAVTVDNIQFSIAKVDDTLTGESSAKYKLSMKAESGASVSDTPVAYTLTAEVKLTFNATTLTLTGDAYTFNVKIAPSVDVKIKDMVFTYGKSFSQKIEFDTDSTITDASKYDWYATGLPAGLGMAKDGTIAGFLSDSSVTGSTINVVASMKVNGSEIPVVYTGISITYTVAGIPVTANVELEFTGAKVVDSTDDKTKMTFSVGGSTSTPTPSGNAVAKNTDTVSFKVTGMTVSGVKAVNSSGTVADVSGDGSSGFTVDVSGTGAYRVVVKGSVSNYSDVTLTFVLNIVDDMKGAWVPAIIINGN